MLSLDVIVNLIAYTTTQQGLCIEAAVDPNPYPQAL